MNSDCDTAPYTETWRCAAAEGKTRGHFRQTEFLTLRIEVPLTWPAVTTTSR
jgi:hypothetical protein